MALPICPYLGWNDRAFHLLLAPISSLLWNSKTKSVVLQEGVSAAGVLGEGTDHWKLPSPLTPPVAVVSSPLQKEYLGRITMSTTDLNSYSKEVEPSYFKEAESSLLQVWV